MKVCMVVWRAKPSSEDRWQVYIERHEDSDDEQEFTITRAIEIAQELAANGLVARVVATMHEDRPPAPYSAG